MGGVRAEVSGPGSDPDSEPGQDSDGATTVVVDGL